MKRETAGLLDKANRSVRAARLLLERGDADFAASRAYYGAFYAAEAYLLERGLTFSSHSAVIAAFGRVAVREAGLPADLHRVLRDAFEHRNAADYGPEFKLTAQDVERLLADVSGFIASIEGWLGGDQRGSRVI
jgi:uncharacterized protein (UPF0332 family)